MDDKFMAVDETLLLILLLLFATFNELGIIVVGTGGVAIGGGGDINIQSEVPPTIGDVAIVRSLDKDDFATVVTKDNGIEGIFIEPVSLEFIIVAYWV